MNMEEVTGDQWSPPLPTQIVPHNKPQQKKRLQCIRRPVSRLTEQNMSDN